MKKLLTMRSHRWLSGRPGALKEDVEALPPFWRDHLELIEGFKHECHSLVIKLLVCFAIAMNLEPNYFARAHAADAGYGNQFRCKS